MGLPRKFDQRLKRNMALHAVWPPGNPIELGDVLQRQDGVFRPIDNLDGFNVRFRRRRGRGERSMNFQAAGVSTTIVQAGAKARLDAVDRSAGASVEISFNRENTYFIRTPKLAMVGIDDMRKVARTLRDHPDWRFGAYYVAWQVYSAKDFAFLASEKKNRKIVLEGKGDAVQKFLTVGASAGMTRTSSSSITFEILGTGGPVAIALAKIRRNGRIVHP